jgi:hypothetical protein
MRDTRISCCSVACLAHHAGIQVVGHRRCAGQRQAGDHGQDGGEGHGRDEAEEQVATHGLGQVHGDHVAAADDGAGGIAVGRFGADHDDGAKADDDQQQVEVADESRWRRTRSCVLPWHR